MNFALSMSYDISGNPSAIRDRARVCREKGELFDTTATALEAISTGGWEGRAAERFMEKFETEPNRWRDGARGFKRAAAAFEVYATALETAQTAAEEAQGRHEEGNNQSETSWSNYSSQWWNIIGNGGNPQEQLGDYKDPGDATRAQAMADMAEIRATLREAAETCEHEVRNSCEGAPPDRAWWESGLRFCWSMIEGIGDALWDLGKLAFMLQPMGIITMLSMDLASGMTPEEIAAKYRMKAEDIAALGQALMEDPVATGLALGKGLLDWDTWADDPGRALGRLIPDIVAAVFTGGSSAAATRGASVASHTDDILDGVSDATRAVNRLPGSLGHLDDLPGGGPGRTTGLDDIGDLTDDLDLTPNRGPDGDDLGDADLPQDRTPDGDPVDPPRDRTPDNDNGDSDSGGSDNGGSDNGGSDSGPPVDRTPDNDQTPDNDNDGGGDNDGGADTDTGDGDTDTGDGDTGDAGDADTGDGPPPDMREWDGPGFRDLDDQLDDPTYSAANRDIIEHDYEALGRHEDGTPYTRAEFEAEFRKLNEDGQPDWNWPPDAGAVPGTRQLLTPDELAANPPSMDRVGGSGGEYFAPDGTPMGERSLPPDRLNFDRSHWRIDTDNPSLRSGDVRLEQSDIAPWFGQDGGGVQYRFVREVMGENGPELQAIPQWELEKLQIIVKAGG